MRKKMNTYIKTLALCLGIAVTAQPTSASGKPGLNILGRATTMDRPVFQVNLTVSSDRLQEINRTFFAQFNQLNTYWQSLGLKEYTTLMDTPILSVNELDVSGNESEQNGLKKKKKYQLSTKIHVFQK
jgi:hypothetical protein